MRSIICITVLFFAVTTGFSEEKVDKIAFHGCNAFSADELKEFLNLSVPFYASEVTLDEQVKNLEDSLIVHDFVFAKVDSHQILQSGKRSVLHIYINESKLAIVENLRWLGDSSVVPEWIASRAMTISGKSFRWDNLRHDAGVLLDFFQNNGYPFARVQTEKIELIESNHTIIVWLRIFSGPYTKIDFIQFAGNRLTESAFLQRETRLKTATAFDQRKIDNANRYLAKLKFLSKVYKERFVIDENGKTGILFEVSESKSTYLDIAAGYVPEQGNLQGQFTGLAKIEFLNLFGVGRRGKVNWERPSRKIQNIEVSYEEPWILNFPLSLQGQFSQRIQDTLYIKRNIGLTAKYIPIAGLNLWVTASNEDILVDSLTEIVTGIPESHTSYLESGFSYDTRDHPTNPRNGVYFSTFAGSGWREHAAAVAESAKRKFKVSRGGLDSESSLEVFPFWIAYIGFHARAQQSNEPEILLPDLYHLGGARTLRGYREEQFLGSRIGWSSFEFRYLLGSASRIFAFADGGSYYRKQKVNEEKVLSNEFKFSTGLGLRLETSLGIFGFDYGIGENDNLLNGKIHVSLFSSF